MISKVTQDSLFGYNLKETLNELSTSSAVAAQLHEDGYLRFNPSEKEKLNAFEYHELCFVCTLFNSGLSLDSIKSLLSKFDKPYCYDITKIYFNFQKKEWDMLPVPEEPSAEELIEDIIADEDVERLNEIQNRIKEVLNEKGKEE